MSLDYILVAVHAAGQLSIEAFAIFLSFIECWRKSKYYVSIWTGTLDTLDRRKLRA